MQQDRLDKTWFGVLENIFCRMPVQYIIKEWDFRDMTLKMEPPVFIPRPETESLVDIVLENCDAARSYRILEICCGTGAISLALLKALKSVSIDKKVQIFVLFLRHYLELSSMTTHFRKYDCFTKFRTSTRTVPVVLYSAGNFLSDIRPHS